MIGANDGTNFGVTDMGVFVIETRGVTNDDVLAEGGV